MIRIKLRSLGALRSGNLDAADPPPEPAVDTHEIEVTEDDWLMDVCDASTAPLLFSCRSGECGICVVRVDGGGEVIDPPTPRELATIALRIPGAGEHTRLGCRVRIRAGGADASVELTMLRSAP